MHEAAETSQRERWLLWLAALFVFLNQLSLMMVQDRPWRDLWIIGVWVVCAAGLHRLLNQRLPHRDPYLLPISFLLVGWGLSMIDRLQSPFADRQAIWLIVASLALTILLYLPHDLAWLRRYRYTWLLGSLLLLLLTVFVGVHPSGNSFHPPRLWLKFWDVYYQPSELLKIVLVAFIASYLADHWLTLRYMPNWGLLSPSFYAPMLMMWGLCVALLIWQRDLGAASIFFIVFMLMLYLASGKPIILALGMGLLTLAAFSAYILVDVVTVRIDVWLNPWQDADRSAYQVVQSLMAFAAGGVLGQGIGQGVPQFIPVVHSDFIFAALAEEWGLVGVLGAQVLIMILVVRGFRIAMLNQHTPFAGLFAAGLSLVLGVQSLMIMGGTLRLVPLTGVTLPFMSYGGSSLLTNFTLLGFLLILSNNSSPNTD